MNIELTSQGKKEKPSFLQRVGTYFIIPLRTTQKKINRFTLAKESALLESRSWKKLNWNFQDLYNSINALFEESSCTSTESKIGIYYNMPEEKIKEHLKLSDSKINGNLSNISFYLSGQEANGIKSTHYIFSLQSIQITIMHSGIGFLIAGIESDSPATYHQLQSPGHNSNQYDLLVKGSSNAPGEPFDFSDFLHNIISDINMQEYSGGEKENILRDTISYSVALVPMPADLGSVECIKGTINQMCLNLRHGQSLDAIGDYQNGDERSFYKYAAAGSKNGKHFVRWGLYTLFAATTQVIFCRKPLSKYNSPCAVIRSTTDSNSEDNFLPMIILALYERYSYLLMSELVQNISFSSKNSRLIKWLKAQMITLKAKGIFLPCDMTPYSNENSFFAAQLELYGIPDAISLLDNKVSLIEHIVAERKENKNKAIEIVVALFGTTSILCDTLDIAGYLLGYALPPPLSILLLLAEVFLLLCIAGLFYLGKK